jgi:rhodanese-related sulfurtransferase
VPSGIHPVVRHQFDYDEERIIMRRNSLVAGISLTALVAVSGGAVTADDITPGNRYDKPRYYHSEISVAETYTQMMRDQIRHRWNPDWDYWRDKSVLVDVRRLREFVAGHPYGAHNIPYPHIVNSRDQDPQHFVNEVYDLVDGDLDRRIMLLCRTGSRSVDAGNLLAEAGFTHVQNIWEGFVGLQKYAFDGSSIAYEIVNGEVQFVPLDLNNDGVVTVEDVADVFEETADMNPDKDGWRNFAGLPWTTGVKRWNAYEQDVSQYAPFMTPVSD